MKGSQDAQGQAFLAELEHGNGTTIIERDDGMIAPDFPGSGYFATFKKWSSHERRAMRYVKGRVLDIGCGAGRHSLHLQDKSFNVVGIDASPGAVQVCQRRGLRNVREMSIERLGSSLGKFDTILLLGNNFGLLKNHTSSSRLLDKLLRITSRKARIIAESLDPYDTQDPAHLEYHELNRQRGRMGGQLRLRVRFQKYRSSWFDYLFVSRDEMQEILKGTGWTVSRFLNSDGPRYIAVISKSKDSVLETTP